jgi:hypothetical protein
MHAAGVLSWIRSIYVLYTTTVKYRPPCKMGGKKRLHFLSVEARIRIDFGRLDPDAGGQK